MQRMSIWEDVVDDATAIKLIQSLADGIDPITGEILPVSSSLSDPRMIRAFFAAVRAREYVENRTEKRLVQHNNKHSNAGNAWSSEEEALLVQELEQKTPIADMIGRHG